MSLVEIVVVVSTVSLLAWFGFGAVAAVMARRRGGGTVPWILLGALLGPIGLYMILKVMHNHCVTCQAPVLRGVRHCPVCAAEIPRLENNPVGPMWTYRRDW